MTGSTNQIAPDAVLAPGKLPAQLLAQLLSSYIGGNDESVIVPPAPGHDAAVIRPSSDLIVKTDPITFATSSPATYLVAVNANDIACLGGVPRWIAVTALFPVGTTARAVEALFDELASACTRDDIAIIGGHTEVAPGIDRVLLSATLIGVPGPQGILQPGGAEAEDDIYLTRSAGVEGASIIATEVPASALPGVSDLVIDSARSFVHDPGISIVSEAQVARAVAGVTAMHDPTEGGVATAIHELADAAGLGVEIDLGRIPVSDATRALCQPFGISPYGLLSSGALLFTATPSAREALDDAFAQAGIQLTRIGRMRAKAEVRLATVEGTQSALPRYDADEITRVFAQLTDE